MSKRVVLSQNVMHTVASSIQYKTYHPTLVRACMHVYTRNWTFLESASPSVANAIERIHWPIERRDGTVIVIFLLCCVFFDNATTTIVDE